MTKVFCLYRYENSVDDKIVAPAQAWKNKEFEAHHYRAWPFSFLAYILPPCQQRQPGQWTYTDIHHGLLEVAVIFIN